MWSIGDVVLTSVAGETGAAPVDEFTGVDYEGKGLGSSYLVRHGVRIPVPSSAPAAPAAPAAPIAAFAPDGTLVALVETDGEKLRTLAVFATDEQSFGD